MFFASALLGMQLPAFLASYRQRVDGQISEVSQTLASYQEIADRNHAGDLQALINNFLASADASSREVAFIVMEARDDLAMLQMKIAGLSDGSLIQQIWHMLTYWDGEAIRNTWDLYQPTVLLTGEAIACSLIAGFLGSLLVIIAMRGPGWLAARLSNFFAVRRGRDMAKQVQQRLQS